MVPAQRRLILAAALVGLVGLLLTVLVIGGGPPAEQERAKRYVGALVRGDYPAMYAELTDAARRSRSLESFAEQHRSASALATAVAFVPGAVQEPRDGVVDVPMTVTTRIFGKVRATLRLPFQGEDDEARVDWSEHLSFPGVRPGERLQRDTRLPRRADILARDGTPLAEGEDRSSPLGEVASAISGSLDAPPPERVERLRELGVPDDAKVGVNGLELIFDEALTGRPGGTLRAGKRVLATSEPQAARAVRTTINPQIQRSAVETLGSRLGGVAALRPRTGEILALAGVAFSGLQPPGSTFKMITLAGALEAGIATRKSTYPVQTETEIEGVEIENADGESCGGSLRYSFAHSCNSVFAPLGVELGAERLVKTAEAFGFNRDPGIAGAGTSVIPAAEEIGDGLAVGSSAIGQGRVVASALQMGWVAATIAAGGIRTSLTLRDDAETESERAISARTARTVRSYMESVVKDGTGGNAAIEGVRVAGKTGTAELRDTSTPDCTPTEQMPECPPPQPDDPTDTDAWFAAFAPADKPRVAVGVLLVENGQGGDTAAPAAKQVLLAGLKATG